MSSSRRRPDSSPPHSTPVAIVNGWNIYAHPLFIDQVEALLIEVEQFCANDSTGYRN